MIKEILALNIKPTLTDPHHRFNSWKHCYNFFKENHSRLSEKTIQDLAALHLGFYLASWGMMRGSTDLLQKDYKIHLKFVREIGGNPKFHRYYSTDNQSLLNEDLIDPLLELIESTRECYREFNSGKKDNKGKMEISDTLVSKILLGVFANVPAYDRLFVDGLKLHGINSRLNRTSLSGIIRFYNLNIEAFTADGLTKQYTPMKLLDMHFWQVGLLSEEKSDVIESFSNISIKQTSLTPVQRKQKVGQTAEVRKYITELLLSRKEHGLKTVELRSGDIHEELKLSAMLPTVCNAMTSLDMFRYEIIRTPPKGRGSNLVIKYKLD